MGRLRVLFVTSWYPSRDNVYLGAFVREQAMALAQDHDVRVIAPQLTRRPGRLASPPESLTDDEPLTSRPTATFIVPRRLSWTDAAKAFSRSVRRSLDTWTAEGWTPDIVHAHTLIPAGWSGLEVARERGIPVVVTVHSSFVSQPVLTRSSESRVLATMTQVDRLIAVGPTVRDELLAIEPECDPVLIPNLVDDEFFSPADEVSTEPLDAPLRLLGIGALIPPKRYDVLLQAVARLQERATSVALTIAGTGPEGDRLKQQAEELGIGSMVTFAGALDRAGIRAALRHSDVFVHPSRYETFGVVLIEAMACGVPVIATRSGGPEWVVEQQTGQLVDVDDPVAIADAIDRVAAGQVSFDANVIRARVIDRFGVSRVRSMINDLYGEVLRLRPETRASNPDR